MSPCFVVLQSYTGSMFLSPNPILLTGWWLTQRKLKLPFRVPTLTVLHPYTPLHCRLVFSLVRPVAENSRAEVGEEGGARRESWTAMPLSTNRTLPCYLQVSCFYDDRLTVYHLLTKSSRNESYCTGHMLCLSLSAKTVLWFSKALSQNCMLSFDTVLVNDHTIVLE